MSRVLVALSMVLAAAVSRCDQPRSHGPAPAPRVGDAVRVRGTLSADVDCRLLRTEDGRTYSLSVRLPNLINGAKICVHGTVTEASQCLTQPMIEVTAVRNWSSCP